MFNYFLMILISDAITTQPADIASKIVFGFPSNFEDEI